MEGNEHQGRGRRLWPKADVRAVWVVALGGLLMLGSSVLPWVTGRVGAAHLARNAFELAPQQIGLDGIFLVLMGLLTIAAAVACLARPDLPVPVRRGSVVPGAVALLVVGNRFPYLVSMLDQIRAASPHATASLGFGPWIAVAGGVLAVGGAFLLPSRPRAAAPDPAGDQALAGGR